ncbi:SMI1/KNR4 family protein [Amycolatopsis sp. RTGN1]|uniref:SMI1/KNR4 family protein n=1 Tax=Amycolatopsis ponsaeliensis TaxID=2992142 RepID=UPI00254E3C58|nr:SMI1/KNR4 family protein [Amycolatopsis sp. RTGN1]
MDAGEYLEGAVRDVLTATEPGLDDQVGYAALLLAVTGALDEADRLAGQWLARTERPATALAASPVRARAWAMLFEARGGRPDWAEGLPPLDLDLEERTHAAALRRPVSDLDGVLPPGPIAEVVKHVAPSRPDRVRTALADGDLARWASLAGQRPDVATLAATRALAPALVAGADPLGLRDWAPGCAGALVAALHERYPADLGTWPELIAEIMRLRGTTTTGPLLRGGSTATGSGKSRPAEPVAGGSTATGTGELQPAEPVADGGSTANGTGEPQPAQPPASGGATPTRSGEPQPAGPLMRGRTPLPPPASEAAIRSAELRLGVDLPEDFREFLRTCDGLPADVVFPRLLGTADLRIEGGVVILAEPAVLLLSASHVVEVDPVLGTTVHQSFRAALVQHATLLAQAG